MKHQKELKQWYISLTIIFIILSFVFIFGVYYEKQRYHPKVLVNSKTICGKVVEIYTKKMGDWRGSKKEYFVIQSEYGKHTFSKSLSWVSKNYSPYGEENDFLLSNMSLDDNICVIYSVVDKYGNKLQVPYIIQVK